MKILLEIVVEIAVMAALNLFLFGYVQRKMVALVLAQSQQLTVYKRTVQKPKIKERESVF